MNAKSIVGNILWNVCGLGLMCAIVFAVFGIAWSITVVGIPMGIQCFKMAGFSFLPFGKEIVNIETGMQTMGNIFWMFFGGIPLGLIFMFVSLVLCVTLIGIPFGMQTMKLAKYAFTPFGAEVRDINR